MLNLPYVPQHYPDEILGSWLARTALLNGRGAWRSLLEDSGFGRRLERPLFDMPDFDSRIDKLFNHLGCSYEYALINLSTFQYWATFERHNNEYLKGTVDIKALIRRGEVVSQLNRVGHRASQSLSLKPYFCSLCLISDTLNFGEPYWHRSHQLPTIYYCPTHHIPLQNECSKCAISKFTGGKNLMPLPSIVCSCGYDYRKQKRSIDFSTEIYRRLTKVSVAALEDTKQHWCSENVKAYFEILSQEHSGSKIGIYSKIKEAFDAEEINTARFSIKPLGQGKRDYFSRAPSTFRTPEYCLVLASLDVDFKKARERFETSTIIKSKLPKQHIEEGIPKSAKEAYEQLLERRKLNPKGPLSRFKMLYWYLRLNAIDTLKCLIPNIDQQPTPTLIEDREKICDLFTRGFNTQNLRPAAMIRAAIRDKDWLERKKQQKIQISKDKKRDARQLQNDLIVEKLKIKLQIILENEERPERITLIRLGAHIGFSSSQMIHLVKKYPTLCQEIKRINNDKMRRQLVWAVKELKGDGMILTAKNIHRKASLPFSSTSSSIVKQLLLVNYNYIYPISN